MAGGLVLVDKPEGPTSFDVVARVRKVMATREVGHCGTLDPLATGVLVVAVGSWTRLVRLLTADDKRYTATISFGTSTTTDDREGEVLNRGDLAGLHEAGVRAALDGMRGPQLQVPPSYSAIHVGGERAYAKARRGERVVVAPREVIIHDASLVSFVRGESSATVVIDVRCGKGTYIRALARDLGERLGVPAHLASLRRTESGAYTVRDTVPLADLTSTALRTELAVVRGVPLLEVSPADAQALGQGKRVSTTAQLHATTLAHVGERLVALVRMEEGALVVERGFGAD